MAAPPLPPKGSPTTWAPPENRGSFHRHPEHRFSDNFNPISQPSNEVPAPPLPPRPSSEAMQQLSWQHTKQKQLINLIVPPPSAGQVYYRNPTEIKTFPNTFASVQTPPFRNGVVFQNSNFAVNYNSNLQRTISTGGQPLAFTNSLYQSQLMPTSFDIQHSRSAPNIPNNNSPNMLTAIQPAYMTSRYSVPNENYNQPTTVNYAVINHNAALASSPKANLENILKFVKKRSDNNLIDLYCGDVTPMSNDKDDILRLFDPLAIPDVVDPKPSATDTKPSSVETKVGAVLEKPKVETKSRDQCDSAAKARKEVAKLPDPEKTLAKGVFKVHECNGSKQDSVLKISRKNDNYNREFYAFCAKLKKLRSDFPHDDHVTNAGLVISPTLDSYQEDSLSIKLIINSPSAERPVSFTCDVNTSVEHIISHTVCTIFDNTPDLCMDNFVLKVHGLSEYFSAHSALADYEYVHQCHKFDRPVCLTLTDIKDLLRPLARTKNDDINDTDFKHSDIAPSLRKGVISFESLSILLDTLEKEMEKMRSAALRSSPKDSLMPQGVVQAVKAICTLLSHVETSEITDAVAAFIQVCLLFGKEEEADFDTLPELGDCKWKKSEKDLEKLFELLELSLLHLQHAVRELLLMYSKAFRVDFEVDSAEVPSLEKEKAVTDFLDTLLFEVGTVHRVDPSTMAFEYFYLDCEIHHGVSVLASVSSKLTSVSRSFFSRLPIDQWLEFGNVSMCTLPQESILYFTLFGMNMSQGDSNKSGGNSSSRVCMGWCGLRLFNYESELAQGCFLLGFWPPEVAKNSGPLLSNLEDKCPLLHVRLPDYGCVVKFPPVIDDKFSSTRMRDFECLDPHFRSLLEDVIEKDALKSLSPEERELIWEKKHYLHQFSHALPKVLLSAHGWDWGCLSDIYSLLKAWTPMPPVDALHLLTPAFPNKEVRKMAISWMKAIVSDELCDYLPQMVQVLRYEPFEDSPVAWFLLERSLTSVRVCHHLYWLLKENVDDPVAGFRMRLMLNSLLILAGQAARDRIQSQEDLMEDLSRAAERIKAAKESLRLGFLFQELEKTHHNLQDRATCLPLGPSLEVCGIDVKSCSYFTSNTLPLRIVFHTPDSNNEAIFKEGDDLRQDMVTLQMVRIMDKLWLREGLDLKIVTFGCVATGMRKGMVEMVPVAETLRKIQTELGLTGSFKDRPIAEWLQKYNTSELEYQQAVENFTLSCAGYCVATYILGICDRHNDNIMLKTSGHMFHIDFGKFLGDSQMFGSIRRDRTPFVLTSDMAFVINGGDRPSKKFQYFTDLCCQAFNIIRSRKNVFFNLFSLMTCSGIPGMTLSAVSYIEKALLPDMSEAEATVHFAQMIQESLKSWFVQFNFFIHNLAQLRFTGDHNDGQMLSFTSKTYSQESDGKITGADVIGHRKLYDPEKYYIYVVKVERENLPDSMLVFRTYREFIEFHQKLVMMFPLAKFHALPGNPLMGRTNVREVADKRKSELSAFLKSLMRMAVEIAHCDLVYSFLHPLLRDQEGMDGESERNERSRRSSSLTEIHGQVKLSIVYKDNSLFVMIMHAKNLSSPKGTAPDPYVKIYLLPDSNKSTKRKTKIVSKNCHPTFMEMMVYDIPLEVVRKKALHVSVWDYDRVQENEFLGATLIPLEGELKKEWTQWYPLGQFNN